MPAPQLPFEEQILIRMDELIGVLGEINGNLEALAGLGAGLTGLTALDVLTDADGEWVDLGDLGLTDPDEVLH